MLPSLSLRSPSHRTFVTGFRPTWIIQDDLISRSLITSEKTLFPNRVSFPHSRDLPWHPLGTPVSCATGQGPDTGVFTATDAQTVAERHNDPPTQTHVTLCETDFQTHCSRNTRLLDPDKPHTP